MHTAKRNIVIIECQSSAAGYIGDIRKFGYEPVLAELPVAEEEKKMNRWIHDYYYALNADKTPKVIELAESYDEISKQIAHLNPVLIIPGSDAGVELAAKLSHDFGLKGHDPANLSQLKEKDCMQEALKKAGLRYIHSQRISTLEEAMAFFEEADPLKVVIKPVAGAATVGVCICSTAEEIKQAVKLNSALDDAHSGFLIQEFIDGTEYMFDTVSCNHRHCPTLGFIANKVELPGSGRLYHTSVAFDHHDRQYKELVEYAMKATEALGCAYGASHSEYMVDEKGPVLIEINCRPCGGMLRSDYEDEVFGYHETELSLRSMFFEDEFDAYMKSLPERNPEYGTIYFVRIRKDIFVKRPKLEELQKTLSTYRYARHMGENRIYKKTVDLETSGGTVYLAGDQVSVQKDVEALRDIEDNHLDVLYDFDDID